MSGHSKADPLEFGLLSEAQGRGLMVNDYRCVGSLAEWLRQTSADFPELTIDDLIAKAVRAPRSWRMGQQEPAAIARAAVGRLIWSGEIEVADGKVFSTRRMRGARTSGQGRAASLGHEDDSKACSVRVTRRLR